MEIDRSRWNELLDLMGRSGETGFVHENYSGRGMYGARCLGIVVGNMNEAFKFFIIAGMVLDVDDVRELAENARTDNMGYDMIVYFPNCTISEDDTPEG